MEVSIRNADAMPAAYGHPAAMPPEKLLAECDVRFVRRGGPGGQHRNKVSTAAILTHRPTGVMAEANERRSQSENRTAALFRLRINLALEIRGRALQSQTSLPSDLWRSRCREGVISINAGHDDFPALLAEALDALDAGEYDVQSSAGRLGCTASQLVKLLEKEPRAMAAANARRRVLGLHPLR